MTAYREFHRRSIADREGFWDEQARLVHWQKPFSKVLDYSRPPFAKWFVGGQTNLCYNAIDRHLEARGDQKALVWISTEVDAQKTFTYRELHAEVQRAAAMMQALGVKQGDRVVIYMPMIPEAAFAILACARIGAVHSVVFGGFAAASLAARIDDAKPKLMITADGGSRMGKVVLYKSLVDEALRVARHPPEKVLIFRRGLDANMASVAGRDVEWRDLAQKHAGAQVPCAWLESNESSYILYTSGTTGHPKGVQRDVGGHAVALAASMKHLYCGEAGETMFTTSDIGWVVGHSYIIYAPLIAGMTTIMYEGVPVRPDAGIWWKIVQDHKVAVMFSAPTAIRVLKKQDPAYMKKYDLSSLKHLFLAGEPLDEPTHVWITESLGRLVIDHYWQTETGWPLLSAHPGVEKTPLKMGSPSFPCYGYDVRLLHETTGKEVADGEKGVVAIKPPLPPGCMATVWGDDARFVETYFRSFPGQLVYTTFDWGIRDKDGYYFILGRTDDVINVAGHRLGTREIEEAVNMHPNIAECAVVGVADPVKGQMPLAFAVAKTHVEDQKKLEKEVMETVDKQLGAIARPRAVHFVTLLPKTRSGKTLRRSIQALAEGRDPGDLTTIEDPGALQQIKDALR
ncbi:MAG: propionate--CoA ligase [Betaproteobacteria bacterium RIFCSPHIGHO2_12_FULL_69_13]|nr:MAG: propionate--CoA ligase [Betaproteobacteria bacterium RIFCSPHIGHO2_12_FULL_69_13]OGA67044.1 MAG: propionate--CoA ligase [Betaproteobacteria bacterium RIFCSPLOWO2_12_FULL_68_20]